MSISVRPIFARIDADSLWVELDDGRVIGVPLAWFPRLLNGSDADRAAIVLSPTGLHWEALDEDISVAGLLEGRGARDRSRPRAA